MLKYCQPEFVATATGQFIVFLVLRCQYQKLFVQQIETDKEKCLIFRHNNKSPNNEIEEEKNRH